MKICTREDLLGLGCKYEIEDDGSVSLYYQHRKGDWFKLKTYNVTAKHKYGKDKTYKFYNIYRGFKNKKQSYTALLEHRLVWIAYNGSIPQNMDVDHIDNNPINNKIENLQLLTRKENIAKRMLDDNGTCWNQYMAMKKYNKGE